MLSRFRDFVGNGIPVWHLKVFTEVKIGQIVVVTFPIGGHIDPASDIDGRSNSQPDVVTESRL